MPTYNGFSTQEVNQRRTIGTTGAYGGPGTTTANVPIVKKYRLTDEQLIIRDLINALSIRPGEKVGQPNWGSTIWNYLFEPNTSENRVAIEEEIRRVVGADPRIILNTVSVNSQENGILLELEIAFQPFNQPLTLSLNIDRTAGTVTQV